MTECIGLRGSPHAVQDGRERRRRDRNSLRGIWQGIWRNQSEQEGGSGGSASAVRPAGVLRQHSLDPGSARTQPGSRASQSSEAHGSRLQSPFARAEPPLPDYQVCNELRKISAS